MDVICLRGIRAYGRHGAEPFERERRQALDLEVRVELDLGVAAAGDDLARTLDYAKLHARIVRIVATTSYALLERLADAILVEMFQDSRVARAAVTIGKPRILAGATPSVTLSRENPSHTSQ